MNKLLDTISYFFTPRSHFSTEEWLLKYQIQSILIVSFFFSIGIFIFSFFRLYEQNYIVGVSQLLFSSLSFYGFFRIRKNKNLYNSYSLAFLLLFFIYTAIIFFYVPQNSLNILWIISSPILIFFFLNRTAGIIMFVLIFSFIIYLILSDYHYNLAEYITLFAAFFITTFIMYINEDLKEAEHNRLLRYNQILKNEVQKQTKELMVLNEHLEERVEEEFKKRVMQEQMLLSQNRMANMGMMIDSIAHQWRQPLMNINAKLMNISRITEMQEKNKKESIDYIEKKVDNIFDITEQMTQTIHDFRNLFKSEKVHEVFDVVKLVEHLLTFMDELLYSTDVSIKNHKEVFIKSYQNELSQVILTILQNAIEVLEKRKIKQKKISIDIYTLSDKIYIEISDNAQGIKEELLEKIFEPYFSTKNTPESTGLGLYIAKIIMDTSLKGEINITNTQDGAKFQLIVPKSLDIL